jgi:hypothetical protein
MKDIRRVSDRKLRELSVDRADPFSVVGRLSVGVIVSGKVVEDVILVVDKIAYQ